MSGTLEFNAERHEYRLDGVVVPAVTHLLDRLHDFSAVGEACMATARERGGSVHQACHFFDEHDLDEEMLIQTRPEVAKYLDGWKLFVSECQPNWLMIEQPVFHPTLRYAGTPDRFGGLTVKRKRIDLAQVDIKTSAAAHPVWGVQTMAYNHAAGFPGVPRFTVQLRPDGTYKLLSWEDPQDWPVFMSLLTLNTWSRRHGLI